MGKPGLELGIGASAAECGSHLTLRSACPPRYSVAVGLTSLRPRRRPQVWSAPASAPPTLVLRVAQPTCLRRSPPETSTQLAPPCRNAGPGAPRLTAPPHRERFRPAGRRALGRPSERCLFALAGLLRPARFWPPLLRRPAATWLPRWPGPLRPRHLHLGRPSSCCQLRQFRCRSTPTMDHFCRGQRQLRPLPLSSSPAPCGEASVQRSPVGPSAAPRRRRSGG